MTNNDHASWDRILRFGRRCLRVPSSIRSNVSLTAAINDQVDREQDPPASLDQGFPGCKVSRPHDFIKGLASRVSAKLEEGDFRGAVRLGCFEDSLADVDPATLKTLQEKHPPPPPPSYLYPPCRLQMTPSIVS